MATTVIQWAKGQLTHDKIGISSSNLCTISSPMVNIVHVNRDLSSLSPKPALKQLAQRTGPFKKQGMAALDDPEPAVHQLLQPLKAAPPQLRAALHQDVCSLVLQYQDALIDGGVPLQGVHVKLEVLQGTPCPRWHADHVSARLLCTYVGPGTCYTENKHVRRRVGFSHGHATTAVESVASEGWVQAGPGDLVMLKGHAWPGFWGLGAVHRSPDTDGEEHTRLLLTIDDTLYGAHGDDTP